MVVLWEEGLKLGYDKKTKQKMFLKALEDIADEQNWPAPGIFEHAQTAAKPAKKRKSEPKPVPNKKQKTDKDQLLRLRMKLQMFLQQKDAYTEQDYLSASAHVAQTEQLSMDIELFKVAWID
jgi:hypothetical protein